MSEQGAQIRAACLTRRRINSCRTSRADHTRTLAVTIRRHVVERRLRVEFARRAVVVANRVVAYVRIQTKEGTFYTYESKSQSPFKWDLHIDETILYSRMNFRGLGRYLVIWSSN